MSDSEKIAELKQAGRELLQSFLEEMQHEYSDATMSVLAKNDKAVARMLELTKEP